MSAKPIPRQSTGWDEHRNTSRVFPVAKGAHRDALAALRTIPAALREWLTDGAPRLTEAEHLARFGEPYVATHSRKGRNG